MIALPILIAQGFSDPQSVDRVGSVFTSPWLLCVFGLLAFAVGLCFWQRLNASSSSQNINDPRLLFRELCHVHGLRRGEIRVLENLAREQKLDCPVLLFTRPELFLPSAAKSRSPQPAVESLRQRLFAVR